MKLLLLYITFLTECKCQRRIGQGIEIDDATKFPFFAQLQRPVRNEPNILKKCGGSLVHPQWILTAGHCFPQDKHEISWMLKQNIDMVFMGSARSYNRSAKRNSFKAILHHPNYRPVHVYEGEIAENDVALGELKTPYEISPTIQTIRLASRFGICAKGTMVGVGRTVATDPNSKSQHLKYAELHIKEVDYSFYRTPTTFYTDVEKSNKYTGAGYPLQGDSGGPFFCIIKGQPVQIGIFSGGGPTNKTVFGIYERVDLHLNFIFLHVPDINYVRAISMASGADIMDVCYEYILIIFCIFFIVMANIENK